MGKPAATQLLKHFTQQELREVTAAAARLGTVQNAELDTIMDDFTDRRFRPACRCWETRVRTRALLTDAVPADQIADMLSEYWGGHGPDIWKSIGQSARDAASDFLKGEHPLTATFILSKLDAALSARIVAQLPRDLRNQVLCRLLTPPTVAPGALEIIENAIRESLLGGPPTRRAKTTACASPKSSTAWGRARPRT